MLHQPIHAGDADRREQPANRRRNKTHEQRDQHKNSLRRTRVDCEWLQRDNSEQKNNRQPSKQNVERDLVRRLLSFRSFHQRDHSVQKCLTRIRSDPHSNDVRQYPCPTRNRRPIAPRLTNHRSRFSGDRRLVHRGHTFDHVAIARNHLPGSHPHDILRSKL